MIRFPNPQGVAPSIRALSPDFMDWPFLGGIIDRLPEHFRGPVIGRYSGKRQAQGQQAANLWMLDIGERVTERAANLAASDAEICETAARLAKEAAGQLADSVPTTPEAIRAKLAKLCERNGVTAPDVETLAGVVARLTDAAWWRRQLRRTVAREIERIARDMGLVQARSGLYASDETVQRHAEQQRRNAAAMAETEAVNSEGEVFNLGELAALGVSNPSVRFAELMVRVRGMESYARKAGHVGLFCTGTAPSHMHARHKESGRQVELFDGTAPREAQQWIARQWSRARTALARLGASYYGVRVAEPHHDGTPHWHMLVFIAPELSPGRSAVGRFMAILRRYLLRGDWVPMMVKDIAANVRASQQTLKAAKFWGAVIQSQQKVDRRRAEKADKNRRERACDFKMIDWSRGSAAGYLVKYLAKNISGERMGDDLECGKPAKETAGRVLAWASCWGIRQFQVVGGPPVGVWRELRKVKEQPEQLELFEAWAATGSKAEERAPDWCRFMEAQGGIEIKRADRPVQLWKLQEPGRLTKYMDAAPSRVAGVVCAGQATATRNTVWTIRRKHETRLDASRSVDRRGVPGRRGVGLGEGLVLGAKRPWTRVNNCTQGRAGFGAALEHAYSIGPDLAREVFAALVAVKKAQVGRAFRPISFEEIQKCKSGTS